MAKKAFGSGYFGEWVDDEFGLHAYHYTCNQINDPKAKTIMSKGWRSDIEHLHQVGNDRIVGVASNFGHVQVRQDEGGPKYLNEFDPEHGHFAGGFGYLINGEEFVSTYYPGNAKSFERFFGIGYFRKKVESDQFNIDQIIFAPFGDDPILISQIKLPNIQKIPVDFRWIEYWGCNMYQFSAPAFGSLLTGENEKHPRVIRQEFRKNFTNEFNIIGENSGIVNKKQYKEKEEEYNPNKLKPAFEDYFPPDTFLVSLDANADVISNIPSKFFGKGGAEIPDLTKDELSSEIISNNPEGAFLLERDVHLEPGETTTLYFMYGYLPNGFKIDELILKYKKNLTKNFSDSCQEWRNNRIELEINDEPWVNREIFWHSYYLRAAMTYDEFFKEHILSQGHVYQYIMGFQGAARDPLQHALPFIFSEPDIVKNIIRYTLKEIKKNGEIPYGFTGSGQVLPVPYKPSDQQLWLLWLVSEYILGTRDVEFLDEEFVRYPIYSPNTEKLSIREGLHRCYKYLIRKIGLGKHGLIRLSNGDWNDAVVVGNISKEKHAEITKVAESVLNSAMTIPVFERYSELLNYIGEEDTATEIIIFSNTLREAVRAQWSGKWLRRAWLTEDLGWIGEDQLWLEPQPWAIIGNVLSNKQNEILVESINTLVRTPSKIGAMLLSKGLSNMEGNIGIGLGTNAGIWPSINGTLIWSLSLVDGKLAWNEWKKNTLAYHAENYPEIWYGIWSGPDTYNSELSKYPGHTGFTSLDQIELHDEQLSHFGINWTDFPVFNLHPHAWPLFNTAHLIGINFLKNGIEINPTLPKDEYRFKSLLIGFEKRKNGYSGWYHPLRDGTWRTSIGLSAEELQNIKLVFVNSVSTDYEILDDKIVFKGSNQINWEIKF